MDSGELIDLFYNRAYEKFVNKQILDDKNYIVPRQQLKNYVNELVNIPYIDFINYIKQNQIEGEIKASDITRFTSFSACEIEMCNALIWANNPGCQYIDIGRFFPDDTIERSDGAYRRYGESHIKAATQLGLAFEYYGYWYLSCIGYIYPDLDREVRKQLLARTIIRNRLYQQLLIDILDHDVNPKDYIIRHSGYHFKRCLTSTYFFLEILLNICRKENVKIHHLIRRCETHQEMTQDEEPLKNNERIEKYLLEIGRQELISIDEEVELAQKVRKGKIDARNKLVSANMRFVVGLAKQYLHKGLEFEDLLHEGFLGLIEAANRFDETRGFKFNSYAIWWIRRYLTDAIVRDSTLIKYPLTLHILNRKIWDFKIGYEQKNGFMPSIAEIETEDEDNLERIPFLDSLPNNLKDTCIPCEDLDIFEDNHNDILDYEDNEYNKKYVKALLSHLSPREQDVLIKFYGIDVREETLESIGEYHGLTRERARQIKEKAVRKLRDIKDSVLKKISETELRIIHFDEEVETKATKDVKRASVIKEISEQISPNSTNNNIPNLSFNKTNQTSTDNNGKGTVISEPANHSDALKVEINNNASTYESVIDKEGVSLSIEKIYEVFNNTVSTYKYFWFISILQILKIDRKAKINIYNITARMVANAWRHITCYRLSFGSIDSLHKITHKLQLLTGISNEAQTETIYNVLLTRLEEPQIKEQLQILTKNVPSRFLTPWMGSASNEGVYDSECFYSLIWDDNNPFININPLWGDYIEKNYDKLIDFSYQKLASFLQKRNPNVEDILSKLKNSNIIKCNNNFHRYTIVNKGNQCGIFDDYGVQVFSSTGRIKEFNSNYYRYYYTYSSFTVNLVQNDEEMRFSIGKRIINASHQTPLYSVLDEKSWLEQIEATIYKEGQGYSVKVSEKWFDEFGNILHDSIDKSTLQAVTQDNENEIDSPTLSSNNEINKSLIKTEEKRDNVALKNYHEVKLHKDKKTTYLLYNGHEFRWKVGDFVKLGLLFSCPITIQGDPFFLFRRNILFVFMKTRTVNRNALDSGIYLLPTDTQIFKKNFSNKYGRRTPRILFFIHERPTAVQFWDEVKIQRIDNNFIRFGSILSQKKSSSMVTNKIQLDGQEVLNVGDVIKFNGYQCSVIRVVDEGNLYKYSIMYPDGSVSFISSKSKYTILLSDAEHIRKENKSNKNQTSNKSNGERKSNYNKDLANITDNRLISHSNAIIGKWVIRTSDNLVGKVVDVERLKGRIERLILKLKNGQTAYVNNNKRQYRILI